ncbi:MAG: glycine--tRNA ligase subunit beta, partial [Elusimicrobia bacterium CG08_land_8_20_14_0_20_51_18]
MSDLLFEIGVENIPARFITSACAQMEKTAGELLEKNNLSYSSVKAYGTYKRLILFVGNVPPKVPERLERFFGPPARLLKNEKGEYTPQAKGFAGSHGVTPDRLSVAVLEKKGETLCFEKKVSAQSSERLFPAILSEIAASLQFPKNMVWEESRFRFARPIRNLVAVYGRKNIKVKIAGIKSSKTTAGSISRGSGKITVKTAGDYFKILEKNHILAMDSSRKDALLKELGRASSRLGLKIEKDEDLVEENVYLTECPVCVVVKFPNEFLELPQELLRLVMKKQLKFFPCFDSKGAMQPYFVGIRDGVSKGQKNVEEGFLSVFEARCRDALFFYRNDLSIKPEELLEKIKAIAFQEKLGSMKDKALRVAMVLEYLSEKLGVRNAELSKAGEYLYLDLASSVVGEFPELQGVMSHYYSKNWGFTDEKTRKALGEFYFPLSSRSELPSGAEGALLSLAGKADTLAGDFALGLIPTGSQDPHGLRRQAYGLVRIIFERGPALDIRELLSVACDNLPNEAKKLKEPAIITGELMEFIWQRAEVYFSEKGFAQDALSSVKDIFMREGSLAFAHKRLEALKGISGSEDFKVLVALHKRAKNILKSRKDFPRPDAGLFEKESERALAGKIEELKGKNASLLAARNYTAALKEIEA